MKEKDKKQRKRPVTKLEDLIPRDGFTNGFTIERLEYWDK